MKNLRTTTAIIVAFMAATPALAGELSQPLAQAAPTPDMSTPASRPTTGWGGFYVGGQMGAITAESEQVFADGTVDLELDGSSHGLHIGYMHDIGNFVLGAELGYDALDFDKFTTSFGGEPTTTSVDFQGNITRLKARIGYNTGRYLPYATAGIAKLQAE